MDSSIDYVPDQAYTGGEGLVGDKETGQQGLPRTSSRLNWTEILARSGLETPGYHEVIEKMKKEGRIKQSKIP